MEGIVTLIVLSFAIAWLLLVLIIVTRGSVLFRSFRDRYPDEARARMSHPFQHVRDPSRVFYFMSRRSRIFLEEVRDVDLLQDRKVVVRSIWSLLILHFGGMAAGGIAALLLS